MHPAHTIIELSNDVGVCCRPLYGSHTVRHVNMRELSDLLRLTSNRRRDCTAHPVGGTTELIRYVRASRTLYDAGHDSRDSSPVSGVPLPPT